jgi:hypothetical protein
VRRAKRHGVCLCVAACILALGFLYGLWQGTYWALAIPVTLGVLTILWLVFWIGYTISTVGGIPEEAEHYRSDNAPHIARSICVCSILLSVVFLIGVFRQSYWALAIPLAGGVLSLLGMVFWIGWAIVMQKTSLQTPEIGGDQPPIESS